MEPVTNPDPLTPEQEFRLRAIATRIADLPLPTLQKELVDLYALSLVRDAAYAEMIRGHWGL